MGQMTPPDGPVDTGRGEAKYHRMSESRLVALMMMMSLASLAISPAAAAPGQDDPDEPHAAALASVPSKADLRQPHARPRATKIVKLYESLVFPTPVAIISGQQSVSDIFDAAVMGRVTPAGHFHDSEAVKEYFFGLAVTPTSRVVGTAFKSLTVSGDKVAVEVDIHFQRTNGLPDFTLRQTGFFTFNSHDRVTSFDLAILNLGAAINPKSVAEQEAAIQGVCAILTLGFSGQAATCPGEFNGFADCVTFMHSIPYGTWDRANSNTFVCRQLHSLLTPFRPAVHCPHCGKTGGNACIDFTYESFFDVEF